MESLQAAVSRYQLNGVRIELLQSDISAEDLRRFQGEVQRDILRAMSAGSAARDSLLQFRQQEERTRLNAAAREAASAFPEIAGIAFATRSNLLLPDSTPSPPAAFVTFQVQTPSSTRRSIIERTQAMLRQRLGQPDLVVLAP